MMVQIERELNETMRMARLAQARKQLVDGLSNRDNAEALADAVIDLAHHLSFISIEECLLVASKVDPAGLARQVQALATYAEKFEYLSPHDLDTGDALAMIKTPVVSRNRLLQPAFPSDRRAFSCYNARMNPIVLPDYQLTFAERLSASYLLDSVGSDYIIGVDPNALTSAMLKPLDDVAPELVNVGMHPDFVRVLRWFERVRELIGMVPPRWVHDFGEAFRCGAISAESYGAATRSIYLAYSPEDESAGQHHTAFLSAFRRAPAVGVMAPTERRDLDALPAIVTLYRGSFAADHETAAQGLSWSRDPHYPRIHLQRRVASRRMQGLRSTPAALDAAQGRRALLVKAEVPREAVLAISHSGVAPHGNVHAAAELIVDYERIPLNTIAAVPMPSEGTVLMSAVLGGMSGTGGLAGIRRAMALGRL